MFRFLDGGVLKTYPSGLSTIWVDWFSFGLFGALDVSSGCVYPFRKGFRSALLVSACEPDGFLWINGVRGAVTGVATLLSCDAASSVVSISHKGLLFEFGHSLKL